MKTGIRAFCLMTAVTALSAGVNPLQGPDYLNGFSRGHSDFRTRIQSTLPPGSQPGPLMIHYPDGRVIPVFEGARDLGSSSLPAEFRKSSRTGSVNDWTLPLQVSLAVTQNWQNGAWVNDYSTRYTTDQQGDATEQTESGWVSGRWVSRFRSLYVEDGNGRQSAYEFQEWRGGRWIPRSRYEERYDADGIFAEELVIYFTESGDLIQEVYRYRDENDSQGNVSVYRSERYTPETPVSRSVLDDSAISGLNWRPWFKQELRRNADGQQEQLTRYSFETGRWVPVDRTLSEYDSRGNTIAYTGEDWSVSRSAWVPSWRILYDLDENDRTSGLRSEIWSGDSWVLGWTEEYSNDRAENTETTEQLIYENGGLAGGTRFIRTLTGESTTVSNRVQKLENGVWADSLLSEEVYDGENRHMGSLTRTWQDGEWSNVRRTLYSYGSTVRDILPEWASLSSYPNPFNARTAIRFSLMRSSRIAVTVYDIRGRKIRVPAEGTYSQGPHEVVWDGTDSGGHPAASGVYVIRLSGSGHTLTRSCSLVR
jgi:hypothetical protein